jgi:hypothetical protein
VSNTGKVGGERVYHGRIISVDLDEVRFPDGSIGKLEMIRHPGASAVVPLLGDMGFDFPEGFAETPVDGEGLPVADPFPLWAGLMDTMEVTDGAEPSVALAYESRLVDLERAEVRRYTDADQQAEYPGDRFFEFVPALQEAEIRLPIQ